MDELFVKSSLCNDLFTSMASNACVSGVTGALIALIGDFGSICLGYLATSFLFGSLTGLTIGVLSGLYAIGNVVSVYR